MAAAAVAAAGHAEQPDATASTSGHAPARPRSELQQVLLAQPRFVRELLAGGIAGGLSKTAVAPLERAKILLQTGGSRSMGIVQTLVYMWQTEGVAGYFKGNGASVLRVVPYAAIHFSAYEWYRALLVQHVMPVWNAGSSTSSMPAAVDGHRLNASLLGGTSGAARRAGSMDQAGEGPSSTQSSSGGDAGGNGRRVAGSNPVWDLLAGSAAGATAVVLTYPLDLVRTQLAYSTEAGPSNSNINSATSSGTNPSSGRRRGALKHGITHQLACTVREGGVTALYRGMMPTLMGILPYAGLKFYCYMSFKEGYTAAQRRRQHATLAAATASGGNGADDASSSSHAGGVASTPPGTGAVVGPGPGPNPKLPVMVSLVFGGVSGLIAQTVTYPLDLVRRRMQVLTLMEPGHSFSPDVSPIPDPSSSISPSSSPKPSCTSSRGCTSSPSVSISPGPGATCSPGAVPSLGTAPLSLTTARAGQHLTITPDVQPAASLVQGTGAAYSHAGVGQAAACLKAMPGAVAAAVAKACGVATPVASAAAAAGCWAPAAASVTPTCSYHKASHADGGAHSRSPVAAQPSLSTSSLASTPAASGGSTPVRLPRPSSMAILASIVRAEGPAGLFRGVFINWIKVVPSTAIGFTVYDMLKSYLDVQGAM